MLIQVSINMKFEELDAIPYLNEQGYVIPHKEWERDEQMDALQFVPRDATVLELGARYGTVSCAINSVLDNPERHVAVEPDLSVYYALMGNRDRHGCKFLIMDGVVSKTPVFMRREGYSTHIVGDLGAATFEAKTMSYDQLEASTGLVFDCLVADMEGGLLAFLEENIDKVRNYRAVLFECDGDCDYGRVRAILAKHGLYEAKAGFHSVWIRAEPQA